MPFHHVGNADEGVDIRAPDAQLGMDLLQRILDVQNWDQLLILDHHLPGGGVSEIIGSGGNDSDRLADILHQFLGQ